MRFAVGSAKVYTVFMEPGNTPPPGRKQLWIATGFILLMTLIGLATLINVFRTAPAPERPAATLNTSLTSGTLEAASTLAPPRTATPVPTSTFTPTPSPTPDVTPAALSRPIATPPIVRAKIEIVWPHGGATVREAELANITAYLINGSGIGGGSGMDAPPCAWEPTVRLWSALNNEPARPSAIGSKRMFSVGGRTYPVWDFNDVDVSAARDPANKLTFLVTVDGVTTLSNIWAHAADARTIFPQTDVPVGVLDAAPEAVDARIQIVWPHDNLPIAEATRGNVTAYLFAAGTAHALAPESRWRPTVRLHWSVNSEPERVGSAIIGMPRTVATSTGLQFLAWDFNDVDISAARDPLNRMYFWITVDDVVTYSTVWAHGMDARTIFPQIDILSSCR